MAGFDRVFVDSDTQFDFMDPAGALYVPGADGIHESIGRLFHYADRTNVLVLSPLDEHPADDPEFSQFPPHCVRDTPGQRKLPFTLRGRSLTIRADGILSLPLGKLAAEYEQLIFPKQTFSVFTNPYFGRLVDALDVGEFVVFGVALDYCVREVTLGLRERGRNVTIVGDAVRAITLAGAEETTRLLTQRGARWTTTDDIIR